ncbi:transferrin [Anthonomus grandis grandis]|uniref:transferrin n=1 Tax=Anthonomus grandis grandis TaxID=2921223 RepID=UPI002165FE6F|nr:transferrin [Anthonomus grandis grandis]
MANLKVFELYCMLIVVFISGTYAEKYRVCVVDGKNDHKQSRQYCPRLDQEDSPVECVVATDRLDCLRRIHKGRADFGVFTPEDLVAAANSDVDILLTNEIRYFPDTKFEIEIVAVFSNSAGIRSKHDLPGKKYCHPGYGYEADWTRILANYFEASVVTPQCHSNLTITENRVKASSDFFGAACKAGPWTSDAALDFQLKSKYPNLCKLCGNPSTCSQNDKYWGRRGSLLCLTDGAGDISWARLEDVQQHFGFTPGTIPTNPEGYSLLCPDNTIMPLNSTNPCIWVVKPWPVIATQRKKAQKIQTIITSLVSTDEETWQSNLYDLINPINSVVKPINPIIGIQTYFHNSKGFLNANSFSGCHPPRTIRICTSSNIETAKCSWLRESAAVYGIEPDLDCLKADNKTHCMMALADNAADVVLIEPDQVHQAKRDFNLKTLFYETVHDSKKYLTSIILRKDLNINNLEDLHGVKACFPIYDGVAWNSVVYTLQKNKLIGCEVDKEMANFFGESCVPNSPKDSPESFRKLCQADDFTGEMGALRCLSSGAGDVAFVSKNSMINFLNDKYPSHHADTSFLKIACLKKNGSCHLSWAPLGQAMVRSSSSDMWVKDTYNVFLQLDALFGKDFKDPTSPFNLFGRYDGVPNVLFHDYTEKLRNIPTVKNTDLMDLPYANILAEEKICISESAILSGNFIVMMLAMVFSILIC